MSAVVQATCPGCRQVLRIPAEWLGQAFKCKHCGMVIQARAKAPTPPPPTPPVAQPVAKADAAKPTAKPVAIPVTAPRPVKSSSADPFAFDGASDTPASSPRSRSRRRSGGGLLKGLLMAGAVLVVAVVGSVFAWPYLSQVVATPTSQVVRHDDTAARGDDQPPRDTGKAVSPPPATQRETTKKSDPPITPRDTGKKPAPPPRDTGKKPVSPPVTDGPFPRRALAVSINNYLFANPINYGMPLAASANVKTLLDHFTQPNALHVPATQVGLLSDAASNAVPPTESVIRGTIADFLGTSRPQDRILLLIVGHVVEIEDQPMLIPIDGDTTSKDGAIPLKWVYEQLAACRARQKVLVLDTCRLDPAKGQERPGSGPMGDKLDALLKEPPPGVQVWSACVAGQFSYEFEGDINNGLFLDALNDLVSRVSGGKVQNPGDPLPLPWLVAAVNAHMKGVLAPLGKEQTSRLSGAEAEGGAEPDPKEPLPSKPRVVGPPPRPGGIADLNTVRTILNDISFPPLKVAKDQKPLSAESLPPFPAEALQEYMKDGKPTDLREQVVKARQVLTGIAARQLNDKYKAIAEGPLKEQVRRDQKEVARLIADLEEASGNLTAAAGMRKDETRRWQATYDYVVARVEAQLAYLNEYQAVLGQILKGLAAPDPKVGNGWRLASQTDPQTGDSAAQKMATASRKKMDKIIASYPDTPWAIMARRDKSSALGLEWQPTKIR